MAFLGMRGTGDWPDNAIPESWREAILRLYPNGQVPLTAIMSMMKSTPVDNPKFSWFEKGMPVQGGAVTDIHTTPDFSVQLGAAADVAEGDILYVQVAQTVADEFRVGHQAQLELTGRIEYEFQGIVVNRLLAGANSYIALKMTEAVAGGDTPVASTDYISVIGNANPEGATMPDAIMYDPEEYENYTQIFRTPLSLTRTARRTRIRYGSDAYQLAKAEALELHALEMEKAFIWGEKSSQLGPNRQPLRTTRGLIRAIKAHAPENIYDFRYDPEFAGDTWVQGGERWLSKVLGTFFTYGEPEKLALHGPGAAIGLADLAAAGAQVNISPRDVDYGIRVNTWITPGGEVNLKQSPLFAHKPGYSNVMLVLEPKRLEFAYIDDTDFIEDPQDQKNRNNSKDATEEEFLTEGGLIYSQPRTAAVLAGIGEDSALAAP